MQWEGTPWLLTPNPLFFFFPPPPQSPLPSLPPSLCIHICGVIMHRRGMIPIPRGGGGESAKWLYSSAHVLKLRTLHFPLHHTSLVTLESSIQPPFFPLSRTSTNSHVPTSPINPPSARISSPKHSSRWQFTLCFPPVLSPCSHAVGAVLSVSTYSHAPKYVHPCTSTPPLPFEPRPKMPKIPNLRNVTDHLPKTTISSLNSAGHTSIHAPDDLPPLNKLTEAIKFQKRCAPSLSAQVRASRGLLKVSELSPHYTGHHTLRSCKEATCY
jgi:hypothetical protein